jgi:hypothetical protein
VAWAPTAIMGVPTMAQARTFVALDVHVSATVAAIIDRDSGELRRQRLSGARVGGRGVRGRLGGSGPGDV